jgi:hypothetical protein
MTSTALFHQSVALRPHPQTACAALSGIEVDMAYARSELRLAFRLSGDIAALAIPGIEEPVRTDGLWNETCCEAFLKAEGEAGYYEFNLSPSSQWAVYRLDGYRGTLQPLDVGRAPVIDCTASVQEFCLQAAIDLSLLPAAVKAADWRLGLSCVIAEASGAKSYWAVNHPPQKPDFHHDDCFAVRIGAAQRI